MTTLKIANWNIEWMNRWFTADHHGAPNLKRSSEICGVTDINALAERVANVIEGLKADILTIQEGPSRKCEMALFVEKFLSNQIDIVGPAGKGQQKIYALVNKQSGIVTEASSVVQDLGFDFTTNWEADIDADFELEACEFTRPPLVLKVQTSTGKRFRLLSLHMKSKYVHGGRELWNDRDRRPEFITKALESRRRISAESMRIRQYLDICFDKNLDAPIIVTGDLNDGPGLDYFERKFLTHNVAGLIVGSSFQPRRMLRHAFLDSMPKEHNYTAIFDDFVAGITNRTVLLDHILVSASLFWKANGMRNAQGQIEHAIFDAEIDHLHTGCRQHLPSDHRPQSVTLEV